MNCPTDLASRQDPLLWTRLITVCHMMMQADSLAVVDTSAAQATVIASIAARCPRQHSSDTADASSGARRFWDSMSAGANLSCTVLATRWDVDACYTPEMTNGKM